MWTVLGDNFNSKKQVNLYDNIFKIEKMRIERNTINYFQNYSFDETNYKF